MKNFAIYYETHGDPKDTPLILISGIGAQLIHWPQKFITDLVNNGFYVVLFDNRDSGLSRYYDHLETKPITEIVDALKNGAKPPLPYSLDDMADDVIKLIDTLQIKTAYIAGISMGGMIAQVLAIKYPERLQGLILMATTSSDPHLPPAEPEVIQFFSTSDKRVKEDIDTYVENRTKLYRVYTANYFNEPEIRKIHRMAYERAYYPEGFVRQLMAILFSEPRGEQLKKIETKSLVLHGSDDPAFPLEHGKHLAACLPNNRFEVIDKMGHVLPSVLSEKIATLISDFRHDK